MLSKSIAHRILKYNRIGEILNFKCHKTNFELHHYFKYTSRYLRHTWNRNLKSIYQLTHDCKPLSYILNDHPFLNTHLKIYPRVLVPRNETENYIYELINVIKKFRVDESRKIRILDLCSGSGCIALSLACNLYNAEVVAIDKSRICCVNIHTNIIKNYHLLKDQASKIIVKRADIFDDSFYVDPDVDIIVSNPPYISPSRKRIVDKNVIKFESKDALFARNGTSFYERIVFLSKNLITNSTCKSNLPKIVFEFDGNHQTRPLRGIFHSAGFKHFKFRKDLRNIHRSAWIY